MIGLEYSDLNVNVFTWPCLLNNFINNLKHWCHCRHFYFFSSSFNYIPEGIEQTWPADTAHKYTYCIYGGRSGCLVLDIWKWYLFSRELFHMIFTIGGYRHVKNVLEKRISDKENVKPNTYMFFYSFFKKKYCFWNRKKTYCSKAIERYFEFRFMKLIKY